MRSHIKMSKTENIFSIVRSVMPYAYDIRYPNIPGCLNSVAIARSKHGEFVFKINHHDMANKNAVVSELLNDGGIHVPHVNVHTYNATCFEKYRIIPGRTLYECMGDMSYEQIHAIYACVVRNFAEMSRIDWAAVKDMPCKYMHQVAKYNVSDVNNPVMGKLFSGAVRAMNMGDADDIGLYHCGLTPENIIVDNNGHFSGIVDLDEVAISNQNYAFAIMAAKYQKMGFDSSELIDYYEKISNKKLNRHHIDTMCNITNVGKYLMWRMSHIRGNTK